MPSKASPQGPGNADRWARPRNYALDFPQSRADARSLLAARRAIQNIGALVWIVAIGSPARPERRCSCPFTKVGTFALRRCFYEAGDFALGYHQSRAAARAFLERRFAARKRISLIFSIPPPGAEGGIRIGDWIGGYDGTLFRTCSIRAGMTIRDVSRAE